MMKTLVGVLMIVTGVIATELCDEPFHRACRNDDSPKGIPRTPEEVEEFCPSVLRFFECGIKYGKRCDQKDIVDETTSYLRLFKDLCDEDTLLYAAILENIQCFSEMRMGGPDEECYMLRHTTSVETLHEYADILTEEGHLTLSDDELDTDNTLECIQLLQELACYAKKLEVKCGTVAMDTYVEVAQKFSEVAHCGETFDYLPTIIRVFKLEEEEADDISEILKKKK